MSRTADEKQADAIFDQIDQVMAEQKAFEDKYQDLLERGSAGDGVAASEYCRALLAGEVTYGVL